MHENIIELNNTDKIKLLNAILASYGIVQVKLF